MLKDCRFVISLTSSLLLANAVQADGVEDGSALYSAYATLESGLDLLVPDTLKGKDTRIRLGAGFGAVPDYFGSNDYRFKVIPIIDIRFKKRWRLNYNRLSFSAIKSNEWELGPFVKYKAGRKDTRNPILNGLGRVKATAQLGIFTKYRTDRMLFNLEYRQALGARQGGSIKATLGHAIFKSGDFVLAAAATGKWLSGQAMQTNFGVTALQADRSEYGLSIFETSSGVSDFSVNLLGRYSISDKYRLIGLVRYGRLVGDAANSPIVANGNGSRNQVKAGLAFTIDF